MLTEIHMQTLTAQVHANTQIHSQHTWQIYAQKFHSSCVCVSVSQLNLLLPLKLFSVKFLGTFGCNIKKHQAFFPPFH